MSIKDNKKQSGQGPNYLPVELMDSTQASNYNPQYIQDAVDQFGIPTDGIFNPYDYISHKNYKMNRRGQASYDEDLARLSYIADLRQQEFQNQYNSPENQAKLLREAGINPDLQGVSPSGSAAGPTPTGSAMANQPTNMQQATNVLGIISNVASLTTGMLQGGLGISNAFKQAASTDISLMGDALDFYSRYFVQGVDVEKLPMPRRVKRSLSSLRNSPDGAKYLRMLINKRDTNVNRSWSDLFQSNFDRFSKEFNKFFAEADHNLDGEIDMNDWSAVWEPLATFAEDILLNEYKLKDKTTKNNLDFQNTTEGGMSLGSMHGASDVESYNQTTFSSSIREPLRQVVKNLKKKADEGSTWANFALIALFFVTNLSGTFGRSTNASGKTSTNFGIGF